MLRLIKKRAACFFVNSEHPTFFLKSYPTTGHINIKRVLLNLDIRLSGWAYGQLDDMSVEEISAFQFGKLRKILIHAGKTVPYWNDVFKKINFLPEKITRLADTSVLPITTRAKLQENSSGQFLSGSVAIWRRIRVTTSGTTGEPLLFYNDVLEIARRCGNAVFLPPKYGNFKTGGRFIFLGLGRLPSLKNFGQHIDGPDLESEEFRLRGLYPLLKKYRNATLSGASTYILRLLNYLKKDGFRIPLGGISYSGESITAEDRKDLTKFFECPVIGIYAMKECASVGIECRNDNYHLLPWLNHVEIIDDFGNPCVDGELGNIVVTYFENMVMPLIRYETGDRGFIKRELCPCGRASKIIVFAGRTPIYFELPDGKKLNASLFENLLSEYQEVIKRFQVEYIEPDMFMVRYIPRERKVLDEKRACKSLTGRIRQLAELTYDPKVAFRKTDDILPNASGKMPILVKKSV